MRLDKQQIDDLTCPPGRRDLLVFDDELHGFGVRVTATGAKTFLLQYQLGGRGGRRVRMTLGRYGDITPTQARNLAEIARGKVKGGQDPQAERRTVVAAAKQRDADRKRQSEADSFTLRLLLDRWADLGLADRSLAHRAEAPRAISVCFDVFLDRPAHMLGEGTIQRALDTLAKERPVMARRVRDYGRAMFNWAVRRHLVPANLFIGAVIEGREVSRDRVLTDEELGEGWRATCKLPYPYGPFIGLLMLTLQRRGEVAGMRWRELSQDLSVWTLPANRTKNGKEHVVHLPDPARSIFRELPRFKGTDLVFHVSSRRQQEKANTRSEERAQALSGFSDAKERLLVKIAAERVELLGDEAAAVAPPDWRIHDFRRTGVTVLARLGVSPHVADRLLNHVQGAIRSVVAVYQRHEFLPERQAALRVWADHVLAVGERRQAAEGNVVQLRG